MSKGPDFPGGSVIKNPPANAGDVEASGSIPGSGGAFGKGNGTHSSVLAWGIQWTDEPGRLQSTGDTKT